MKRTLALTLAAIMLIATLAGCAGAPAQNAAISPRITLTSSDAADAAAWLTARLDAIPDRVVIGTSADKYGVDVSALEDDGYFIRALDGKVALFARTAIGLDRAVRKYAKTVEAGEEVCDVTYHEGYRVKSLTIAGNDISEYAIVRVTEDDPCVTTAANELAAYIEAACGAVLPVCTEADFAVSGRARKIAISSGDESLGDEGFRITVGGDGTLAIEGGIRRGAFYGALDLLEDVGWRFIATPRSYYDGLVPTDRQEYLYESERVDLTAEINRTEIPSIPVRGGCLGLRERSTYATQERAEYGGYGFAIRCDSGLQNNHSVIFSGEYEGIYPGFVEAGSIQPCFTDEDILEAIDHYALEYVRIRLEAGQEIGREILAVDVGHWDAGDWSFCRCKNCQKVYAVEGHHTGAVLRMANRVAALLDENYPGVSAAILVYGATAQLPRITRPAHNIYLAFCFFGVDYVNKGSCQNHCISGEECDQLKLGFTNYYNAQFFEEWTKVADPKMIQVWYYPSEGYDNRVRYYDTPMYTNILRDMKYLASFNVEHVYYCMERNLARNNGVACEGLVEYLGSKYMWDASITEDEAHDILREWFVILCGEEAAGELLDLALFSERAGDLAGCWCSAESYDCVNYEYVAAHADEVWAKCLRAAALADDAAGEECAERFAAGIMYMIVCGSYEDMYVNGTDEERAVFTERYRVMFDKMCEVYGFDPDSFDPEIDPASLR